METKADYDTLRKLYFGSHIKNKYKRPLNSSFFENETPILEGKSNALTDDCESITLDEELEAFKSELSQRSLAIISSLYKKYGTGMYNKIDQMIESENFTEWEELQRLLTGEQSEMIFSNDEDTMSDDQSYESSDDLDYLDALLSHDYRRMNALNNENESISSIFTEILENEPLSNQNYEDDVFNQNIALIFNDQVDLDNSEWSSVQKVHELALNEAIEHLKEEAQISKTNRTKTQCDLNSQANLNAFYAHDKLKAQATQKFEIENVDSCPIPWYKRLLSMFKLK